MLVKSAGRVEGNRKKTIERMPAIARPPRVRSCVLLRVLCVRGRKLDWFAISFRRSSVSSGLD